MKNAFKLGFLALALSLSVAACSSNKQAMGTSDSTKVDSATTSTTTTTDSAATTDTTKKDTTTKM